MQSISIMKYWRWNVIYLKIERSTIHKLASSKSSSHAATAITFLVIIETILGQII